MKSEESWDSWYDGEDSWGNWMSSLVSGPAAPGFGDYDDSDVDDSVWSD